MDSVDNEKKSDDKNHSDKLLAIIQLAKEVRKTTEEKSTEESGPSTSSTSDAIVTYEKIKDHFPRTVFTSMLSSQIERHRDQLSHAAKEKEYMKQMNDMKAEVKKFKERNSKLFDENDILRGELMKLKTARTTPTPASQSSASFRWTPAAQSETKKKILGYEATIKELMEKLEKMEKELATYKNRDIGEEESATVGNSNVEDPEVDSGISSSHLPATKPDEEMGTSKSPISTVISEEDSGTSNAPVPTTRQDEETETSTPPLSAGNPEVDGGTSSNRVKEAGAASTSELLHPSHHEKPSDDSQLPDSSIRKRPVQDTAREFDPNIAEAATSDDTLLQPEPKKPRNEQENTNDSLPKEAETTVVNEYEFRMPKSEIEEAIG